MKNNKVAIIGTAGVPANYGGFETLAENLVKYQASSSLPISLTVYCSSNNYPVRKASFLSARLIYVPLDANGMQSVFYDFVSLFSAVLKRNDVILLLGVSGAIALPLIRFVSKVKIIANIDGIEWRREKWKGWAKHFLRFSEKLAVRYSHEIIADNKAIDEYVFKEYGIKCHLISYGGDQASSANEVSMPEYYLPDDYAFLVCRIEPENNVDMILKAFSRMESHSLVVVGNWKKSRYGVTLYKKYANYKNILMLDPIYDLKKLKFLRSKALYFIHGHSAGGTNPSLVEAMHLGKGILAYDCNYNRNTTENKALFFKDSDELVCLVKVMDDVKAFELGQEMKDIALRRYTWNDIAQQYFSLLIGEV